MNKLAILYSDPNMEIVSGPTFILKNVILVKRSTMDFKSASFSGLLAGKLFYLEIKELNMNKKQINTILQKPLQQTS